jgi:hypothetical protein
MGRLVRARHENQLERTCNSSPIPAAASWMSSATFPSRGRRPACSSGSWSAARAGQSHRHRQQALRGLGGRSSKHVLEHVRRPLELLQNVRTLRPREAWWRESPLNRVFGSYGRWRRKEVRQINLLKLRFCGSVGRRGESSRPTRPARRIEARDRRPRRRASFPRTQADPPETYPQHYRLPLCYRRNPEGLIKRDFDPRTVLAEKTRFWDFVYSNARCEKTRDLLSQALSVQARRLGRPVFEQDRRARVPVYWGNPLVHLDFNPRSFLSYHEFGESSPLPRRRSRRHRTTGAWHRESLGGCARR